MSTRGIISEGFSRVSRENAMGVAVDKIIVIQVVRRGSDGWLFSTEDEQGEKEE